MICLQLSKSNESNKDEQYEAGSSQTWAFELLTLENNNKLNYFLMYETCVLMIK